MNNMKTPTLVVGMVLLIIFVVVLLGLLMLFSWWLAGELLARYAFERLTIALLILAIFVCGEWSSSD